MSDQPWGDRDSRGEWQPSRLPKPGALFGWPWKPLKALKNLWDNLWPHNLIYMTLAILVWLYLTPSLETTKTFDWGWVLFVYLRNVALVTVIAGGLHLWLYVAKTQSIQFKYNDKWMARKDKKFLFGNQVWDNIFWNLTSGCLIWSAYEVVTLWAFSNKLIPLVDFRENPVYFVLLMWAVIYLRYFHFYFVHWVSHWKPLFKVSHYLHHKNVNIGPWSGLSMHPIEHLLYFSGVLLHWVIPSSPAHAIFHLLHAGVSPALGHTSFHKLLTGKDDKGLEADHYFHYLHHRYFTVNFGVQEFPLDWWFKTVHDGSPESHAQMMAARKKKAGKAVDDDPV